MKNEICLPCKQKCTMYENILNSATKYPNRNALIYFFKNIKYKTLLKRINSFAYHLKDIGVRKDDIVTICLPNIPDAVYLLYAINQIGAIANIVHPLFTTSQMDENLFLTKSKYLFVLDANYEKYTSLVDKYSISLFACSPKDDAPIKIRIGYSLTNKNIKSSDMSLFYKAKCEKEYDKDYLKDSILLHSGGTSGKSKIIALSNFAINSVSTNTPWIMNWTSFKNKNILAVLPMFHGFGLVKGIHSMLCHGGGDVLMPKFSRNITVNYIARNKLHILIGVPVLYEALLSKKNFRFKKLRHLEIAFVGGDYVSSSLLERFNIRMEKAKSRCRLREGYGLTEAVNVCAVNTHQFYKPGTVGRLLPNVKGIIIDENDNILDNNQEGEILIGGDTIMNGYRFNDDESVNEKSIFIDKNGDKYIRTGDFGFIDKDRFLYFKTRLKRIVKVKGVNVFQSMIEDAATSFNFVYETCAIGIQDEKYGHIIKLYVKLSKEYQGSREEAIKKIDERIVSRLGIYSKPKEIIILDKMPHTALGKIDYKALK